MVFKLVALSLPLAGDISLHHDSNVHSQTDHRNDHSNDLYTYHSQSLHSGIARYPQRHNICGNCSRPTHWLLSQTITMILMLHSSHLCRPGAAARSNASLRPIHLPGLCPCIRQRDTEKRIQSGMPMTTARAVAMGRLTTTIVCCVSTRESQFETNFRQMLLSSDFQKCTGIHCIVQRWCTLANTTCKESRFSSRKISRHLLRNCAQHQVHETQSQLLCSRCVYFGRSSTVYVITSFSALFCAHCSTHDIVLKLVCSLS